MFWDVYSGVIRSIHKRYSEHDKKADPKKIDQWERARDQRRHYRCERCGAEWRCEYFDNKFGSIQDYIGDPDILCQCCGKATVKEVIMREVPESLKGVNL